MPAHVRLVAFGPDHLPLVEPWFDHPEVQARLGNRDWPARELELLKRPPGFEFRGATVTGRHDFVAFDGDEAVGLLVAETYDRWTPYEAETGQRPPAPDAVELPSMSIALVVNPRSWSRGYCREMIEALLEIRELAAIKTVEAGVEPDNVRALRCLEGSGFVAESNEPDREGMLRLVLVRRGV